MPPVKKKLLWKRGKKKSLSIGEGYPQAQGQGQRSSVEFSDDDLDVPRDRIFRKNPRAIKFKVSCILSQREIPNATDQTDETCHCHSE